MHQVEQPISITLDSEKLGREFILAVEKVAEIRASRRAQYADEYLTDDYLFLCYQIQNKVKRFKLQMQMDSSKESIKNKEVALDSALDCTNYALFLVAKLLTENAQ
jgi:hypothetical protein